MRRRWGVEHCSVIVCLLAGTTLLWLLVLSIGSRATAANVLPGSKQKHYWWFNGDDDESSDIPFRLTGRACLGLVGSFLAAALSNAAGIGGGAFFVPLFNIVVGFGLKTSTGLSQAAIVGGSLTGLVFNLCMRHPWDPSRPLVDLDVALVLTPALLLGVSAGVLLNDLLPDWFITLLLVSLLLVMARRTVVRGCTSWAEETQQHANLKAAEAIGSGPMPTLRRICTDHVPSCAVLPSLGAPFPPVLPYTDSSDEDVETGDSSAAAGGKAGAAGQADGAIQQQQQQQQPGALPLAWHDHHIGGDQSLAGSNPAHPTPGVPAEGAGAGACSALVLRTEHEHSPGSSVLSKQRQLEAWCQQQQQQLLGTPAQCSGSMPVLTNNQQQQQVGGEVVHGSMPPAVAAGLGAVAPGPCYQGLLPDSMPGSAMSSGGGPMFSALWAAQQARYRFPWVKLCCLVLLWLGFLGLSALDAMLPLCSWQYVSYMLVFILLTVCVTCVFTRAVIVGPSSVEPAAAASSTRSQYSRAKEARSRSSWWRRMCWWKAAPTAALAEDVEGQQQLEQPFITQYPSSFADIASATSVAGSSSGSLTQGQVAAAASLVAGAAGVLAGMVGLGGGTMIGPILLEFKIHPQVASATSVVLVFISSSAATLSFAMEGRLVMGYALVFAGAAAAGSLSGVTLVAALVRRTGRPSAVILLLAGCMAAGALLSGVFGAMDMMASIQDNDGLQPRSICPAA